MFTTRRKILTPKEFMFQTNDPSKSITVLSILANGPEMVTGTEKESKSGQMALNMKDTGSWIKPVAREELSMPTATFIKETGVTIKPAEGAFMNILVEPNT